MKEAKYIYFNRQFVDWKDAKIHILSHVVQYGSGVFEGIRCYSTKKGAAVFRGLDHFKRFKNSMKIYRMEIKENVEELENITKELLIKNELESAYIRPIVYRGYGEITPNPIKIEIKFAIAAFEREKFLEEDIDKGVDVIVSSWRRFAPDTVSIVAKASGNYLNSQLASMEASTLGFREAIMLDVNGFVSEGSAENVFIVRDGVLYTPPLAASILRGITRDSIMKIAQKLGITVKEEFMLREMLYISDEAFFTGTAAEVTPISSIDRITIGNGMIGEITRKIRDAFFDIIHNGNDPFGWLDFVK